MLFAREEGLFENRYDAGRKLAERLEDYKGQPVVVVAIPNGGVPVGLQVALALESEFDLIISRKIPLPLNPEAGFGAVTDDGTVILNEELVKTAGLSPHQINYQVSLVRAAIRQRTLLYKKDKPPTIVSGKIVIVTDDGLASGFTMLAAVTSLRRRQPKEIIAAVPVASTTALQQMEKAAVKVVTVTVGTKPRFAVADFYRYWYDLNDDEVLKCLKEWQMRRFRSNIKPPTSIPFQK